MSGQVCRFLRQGISCSNSLNGLSNGCLKNPELTSKLLSRNHSYGMPGLASIISRNFHASIPAQKGMPNEPQKWPKYNEIIYPPKPAGQPMRVAEVFHHRSNIKYSYKKMWYIASMIRGMSIDEAIKQMEFLNRAGGQMIIEILREAQEMAVAEHNVEYRSNLWVAESFVGKAHIIKSLRKHRGYRFGTIRFGYIHYFVCLREGKPPEKYYTPNEKTGQEHLENYLQRMRNRRVHTSL